MGTLGDGDVMGLRLSSDMRKDRSDSLEQIRKTGGWNRFLCWLSSPAHTQIVDEERTFKKEMERFNSEQLFWSKQLGSSLCCRATTPFSVRWGCRTRRGEVWFWDVLALPSSGCVFLASQRCVSDTGRRLRVTLHWPRSHSFHNTSLSMLHKTAPPSYISVIYEASPEPMLHSGSFHILHPVASKFIFFVIDQMNVSCHEAERFFLTLHKSASSEQLHISPCFHCRSWEQVSPRPGTLG